MDGSEKQSGQWDYTIWFRIQKEIFYKLGVNNAWKKKKKKKNTMKTPINKLIWVDIKSVFVANLFKMIKVNMSPATRMIVNQS